MSGYLVYLFDYGIFCFGRSCE